MCSWWDRHLPVHGFWERACKELRVTTEATMFLREKEGSRSAVCRVSLRAGRGLLWLGRKEVVSRHNCNDCRCRDRKFMTDSLDVYYWSRQGCLLNGEILSSHHRGWRRKPTHRDTAKWQQAPGFGWRRDSPMALTYVTSSVADVSTVLSHSSGALVVCSGSLIELLPMWIPCFLPYLQKSYSVGKALLRLVFSLI